MKNTLSIPQPPVYSAHFAAYRARGLFVIANTKEYDRFCIDIYKRGHSISAVSMPEESSLYIVEMPDGAKSFPIWQP